MHRRHALILLLLISGLAAAAPRLKDIPDDDETKALNASRNVRVEFIKGGPVAGDDFCKLMEKLNVVFSPKARNIFLLNSRGNLTKFEWDLIRSHPNVKSLIPLKEATRP